MTSPIQPGSVEHYVQPSVATEVSITSTTAGGLTKIVCDISAINYITR